MAAPALTVQLPGRAARAVAAALLWVGLIGCASQPSRPAEIDAVDGFSLILPAGWARLKSGDAGWADVYTEPKSDTERAVDDGTIAFFAVPLPPDRSDRELNLAVYVHAIPSQPSLVELADSYEDAWAQTGRITKTDRTEIDLPAGHAVRLTGRRTETAGDPTRIAWLRAYVVVHGSRAYYVLPVCAEDDVARYQPIFDELLASLRFL